MKITIKKVILLLIILFVFYVIYAFTIEKKVYMGRMVEIYVPIFNKYEVKEETHSGFRNDGKTFITMQFSDRQAEKFIKKIKENEHWRELPFTGFFTGFFEIENGYWFAIDRFYCNDEEYDIIKYDVDDMGEKEKHVLNYTLAVFDTDNNIFYFYEMDT